VRALTSWETADVSMLHMVPKALIVLGGLMLVSVTACGIAITKPQAKAVAVDSTVVFPNVIGMR
jgi:hypothetical protein